MKLSPNIALSENGFIFDPVTGQSYTLNPIGLEIANYYRQQISDAEIVDNICRDYDIEPLYFQRDLEDFKELLREYKLAENEE
jgi:hypothetical protein